MAFTFDSLGETKRAQSFVVGCRDQFVRFYLGRAMRYDAIQPYKPSAGFLFSCNGAWVAWKRLRPAGLHSQIDGNNVRRQV